MSVSIITVISKPVQPRHLNCLERLCAGLTNNSIFYSKGCGDFNILNICSDSSNSSSELGIDIFEANVIADFGDVQAC